MRRRLAAIQTYEGKPEIKTGVRLRGKLPPQSVGELLKMCSSLGVECIVSLSAEWPVSDAHQLRLFPADYGKQTVADIERWLTGG